MPDDVARELAKLAAEVGNARERLGALRQKLVAAKEVIESARRALGEGEATGDTPLAQEEAKAG